MLGKKKDTLVEQTMRKLSEELRFKNHSLHLEWQYRPWHTKTSAVNESINHNRESQHNSLLNNVI